MRRNASMLALTLAVACLAPATLHAAIASTAGLIFEAAPFVVAAEMLAVLARRATGFKALRRQPVGAWLTAFAGCGCSGMPGALSVPAAALTWVSFGPGVAAARVGAGLVLARLRHAHTATEGSHPLDQLGTLVPYAFAGALAADALRFLGNAELGSPPVAFLAGALAGAASPCALGAVALAASLRHGASWATAGLLATAGLVPRHTPLAPLQGDARIGYLLLGAAAGGLVAAGGAGLVHPRLVVPAALAVTLGLATSLFSRPRAVSLLGPAAACAGLLLGSPVPHYAFDQTNLLGAFAGESVQFTGTVERRGGVSLLVRFAITCCRADATPIALRLERNPPLPDGTWATAEGVLIDSPRGLVLRAQHVARTRPPSDRFLYR